MVQVQRELSVQARGKYAGLGRTDITLSFSPPSLDDALAIRWRRSRELLVQPEGRSMHRVEDQPPLSTGTPGRLPWLQTYPLSAIVRRASKWPASDLKNVCGLIQNACVWPYQLPVSIFRFP